MSLRAFLRTLLQNNRIAESKSMEEFLTARPIKLNEEELLDVLFSVYKALQLLSEHRVLNLGSQGSNALLEGLNAVIESQRENAL